MREIMFRGNDVKTGKWCYGDLIHKSAITETGVRPAVYINNYEVVPDVVGQFTGVKDKNGKKIFEGDIVKVWDVPTEVKYEIYDDSQGF